MAVLSTGLIYLPQDEEEDLKEQCTPERSPAKAEQRFVQEHFTATNSLIFSVSRKSTEVNYASVLVLSKTETLLRPEILEDMSKVEGAVQASPVTQGTPPAAGCALRTRAPVSPQPTLVRLEKGQRPQPENHHLPHLQPRRSGGLPGRHPGRNCLRRESGADPGTPPGQSPAATVPPEDR